MAKLVPTTKVDQETKTKDRKPARAAGPSLSRLVDPKPKEAVASGQVNTNQPTKLHPAFEKKLKEIDEDIKAGRNLEGPFKTADELLEALNLPKNQSS